SRRVGLGQDRGGSNWTGRARSRGASNAAAQPDANDSLMDEKPISALELKAAFAKADDLTRSHSKTFYLATGLLPAAARRAIRALYAFCRSTDDLVDVAGATVADVERWRAAAARPAAQQA